MKALGAPPDYFTFMPGKRYPSYCTNTISITFVGAGHEVRRMSR